MFREPRSDNVKERQIKKIALDSRKINEATIKRKAQMQANFLNITDYLSRNPISNLEPSENYDEENVINGIIPFLEFINKYGSITDKRETTTRMNQMNSHKSNSQSNSRYVLMLQTNNNQQQNRSSLVRQQNSVYVHRYKDKQSQSNKMNPKTVETIKKEDPSNETLKLTTRWKEITKPGGPATPRDNGKNTTLPER